MSLLKNIDGYILAGGLSSRMGSDKGLLKVNNRCLIEYVIDHLKPCVDRIFICADNAAYIHLGYPLIADSTPQAGPAGGIAAALRHATATSLFVISCDTPFVSEQLIRHIILLSAGAEITIPLVNGYMEPLSGVYSKSCDHDWQEMLNKGQRKMQAFIEHFNYRVLDYKADLQSDEGAFININTPEDFENAKKERRWL